MDKVPFNTLLTEIKYLVDLMQRATEKLSEVGIEHGRPTTDETEEWHELIKTMREKTTQLQNGIQKNDIVVAERPLTFFRTLSKLLDSYPYYWSAYYEDINSAHDKVCSTISLIDKKYTLGAEKIRQMETKNQQNK